MPKIVQPDNRPVGKVMYLLCAPFEHDGVHVLSGFINDGGSVPRWAWSISGLTPDGIGRAAWVGHDFLYRYAIGTRKNADLWMRRALIAAGMAAPRAQLAYMAVRVGGRRHFGSITPPNRDNLEQVRQRVFMYHKAGALDSMGCARALNMLDEMEKAARIDKVLR